MPDALELTDLRKAFQGLLSCGASTRPIVRTGPQHTLNGGEWAGLAVTMPIHAFEP